MISLLKRSLVPVLFLLLLPALAQAHPGHDGHDFAWDLSAGFAHPFTGWDHLVAMLAVGVWAAVRGGRSRWQIPAAFVGALALGAIAGRFGGTVPGIEQGVAASLLGLGLLIAIGRRLSPAVGGTLVALFGIFHGYAHGAEIPAAITGIPYGMGFVSASVTLQMLGIGLGSMIASRRNLIRCAGGAVACAGALALILA